MLQAPTGFFYSRKSRGKRRVKQW